MPRTKTPIIPFTELKKICIEKGIKSWEEYQKRYTEIEGAKKTLHATYKKEWKGNRAFFVNPEKEQKALVMKKAATNKPKKIRSRSQAKPTQGKIKTMKTKPTKIAAEK